MPKRIGNTPGCINDVHNVRNFITSRFGFPQDGIVVLTDDQQNPSYQPTRANIVNAIRWLVDGAQPGDSLLFHFSGHGSHQKDESKFI
jgi:uncharacterized caspase-like protein